MTILSFAKSCTSSAAGSRWARRRPNTFGGGCVCPQRPAKCKTLYGALETGLYTNASFLGATRRIQVGRGGGFRRRLRCDTLHGMRGGGTPHSSS